MGKSTSGRPKKIRTCKLGDTVYSVKWQDVVIDGGTECFGVLDYEMRELKLDSHQASSELLNTLIHECLHAEFPELKEPTVEHSADRIADVLYRVGYRLK